MTLTGSGVGGNVGGPLQPTQRDVETTAWSLMNKTALGIMPDTLEVPFSQLGGNVWKYQSDANRPTLKSLANLRTSMPDESVPDESWTTKFQELVGKLHPQLKERLAAQMQKPFASRDPNYSIFENLLTMTAKGLAWLEQAQQPMDPNSPASDRLHHARALPGKALKGTINQSHTMLAGTQAFLKYVGPNHPFHDQMHLFAQQGEELQQQLNALMEQWQAGEPPSPDELTQLANKAINLSNGFNRQFLGNDMQILGSAFQAMAAMASALSLTPTFPTLFLGLKMATTGLFSNESSLGFFGPSLEALIKALSQGLLPSLMKNGGTAKKMMLIMTLLGALTGTSTLAGLISRFGMGHFPAESEGDQREGRVFTFQLLLDLLASSGWLNQIYKICVEASGGNENAQEIIADIMEFISLVTMALTASQGKMEDASVRLEDLQPHLEKKLNKIERLIISILQSEPAGTSQLRELDVAIKQAKLAVSKDNFLAFLSALRSILPLIDTASDQLEKDLEEMNELAKLLKQSCVPETRATSITGMIRTA